jgi:flagellar motor switch protein FliG
VGLIYDDLTEKEKVAILLISLGPETSSDIMKNLSEEEIEQLTVEITKIKDVSPEIKEKVLSEYYDLLAIQEYVSQGGIAYAKEILEKAVGSHKTAELLNRLTASLQEKPFHFARKVDANQLLGLIQHESPQVIAIVLSYLPPKLAGQILCMLPQENQTAVIERIATMDKTSTEYIKEIERMLERKLSAAFVEDFTEAGGLQSAVDILNVVDRATEKHILESLFKEDTGLAEKIRKKMFVFEDLTKLDPRSIQRVIKETDVKVLATALKHAAEEVKNALFDNMSSRMKQNILDDMEYMGKVRMKEVEDAQQQIVNIVRQLEEEGEIFIIRGQEEKLVG